jgi:hypothetical protein
LFSYFVQLELLTNLAVAAFNNCSSNCKTNLELQNKTHSFFFFFN